jgi:hypothetical protein
MATAEQFAAFQTAVASGNIQEAANIAALAGILHSRLLSM